MQRPRVLIVEDRASVLKVMATVLEGAYEVSTASDAAAALALIGSSPVDVVLTDIRMPGASGFEVLRAVQERAPETEVVMMTAYANVPDAVAAIKQGAYDYVAKPIDADEIALVVARAVEHRVRRREEGHGAALSGDDRRASLPDPGALSTGFHRAMEEARRRASRQYLTELLRLFRGNVTHAAKRAGMTRESLHRVLRKYGVRHEDPGQRGAHRDEDPEDPSCSGGAHCRGEPPTDVLG